MKLFTVIKKNYKFLLHHKLSTAAVVLGPILLIVLAGLAFNSTELTGIKVGMYSDDSSAEFMDRFRDMLSDNNFKTFTYDEEGGCKSDLQKGVLHVCTIYSSNDKKINFIVDSSKINLAYAILSVMSQELDSATEEMGFALTTSLLKQITSLKSFLDESIEQSDDLLQKNRELSDGLRQMSNELYSLQLHLNPNFDFDEVKKRAQDTDSNIDIFRDIVDNKVESSMHSLDEFDESAKDLQAEIDEKAKDRDEAHAYLQETYDTNSCTSTTNLVESSSDDLFETYATQDEPECTVIYTLQENLDACTGDLDEARQEITNLRDTIQVSKSDLKEVERESDRMFSGAENDIGRTVQDIDAAEKEVENLERASEDIERDKDEFAEQLIIMSDSVNQGIERFEGYKVGLIDYKERFDNYSDMSARDIVSPVVTSVEGFDESKGMIDYFLPTLIVFIMMFVGILLGNILISKESKSTGFFRNLISPTNDYIFLFGTIITTISIVVLQILVVFALAVGFLNIDVMGLMGSIGFSIIVGALLFTLIGVIIGCIVRSEETSMIVAIILSLILLIFSGTLIPIESTPAYLHPIIRLNPFLLITEMMSSIIIYKVKLSQLSTTISILLGYVVLLVGMAIAFYNDMKSKYMN